ncbi:MAG: PIN domain-containing protein [Rhodocyclales bacterium]|nr:PIN domain-containing protein [Rhodocyclales bacterium]
MVLVDSSVWIDLLRGLDTAQTRALSELVTANEAALAPVIYQEILQGAASMERLDKLRATFRTLPFLLPRHAIETYAAAAELFVRCRQQGITPRSPHDCLVARIAIENGVALLHDDRDYESLSLAEPALRFHPV